MPPEEAKPEFHIEVWFAGTKWLEGKLVGKEDRLVSLFFTHGKEIVEAYNLELQQEFKILFRRVK